MAEVLELKAARHARGTVRLPGSKSISNRVLLLAALADGETEVSGLLDADDTRVMREALSRLGIGLSERTQGVNIRGSGGPFAEKKADLFLGNCQAVTDYGPLGELRHLQHLTMAGDGFAPKTLRTLANSSASALS